MRPANRTRLQLWLNDTAVCDHDWLERAVVFIHRDSTSKLDYISSLDHTTDDDVLAVEVRCFFEGDEELLFRRLFGHCEQERCVKVSPCPVLVEVIL